MSYLVELKAEFSEKVLPGELTKPTKGPSVSFVSVPSRHVSEIEVADEPLSDTVMEARRQRVLTMLDARPSIKYAMVMDDQDADTVVLMLAVRGQATCELNIARVKYDPFLLLALIDRCGDTVHRPKDGDQS